MVMVGKVESKTDGFDRVQDSAHLARALLQGHTVVLLLVFELSPGACCQRKQDEFHSF